MQIEACGFFPSKQGTAPLENCLARVFHSAIQRGRMFLHTFCGQQCAQASTTVPKHLILKDKLIPAFYLSSQLSTVAVKVLHGICG
jgi:hypothetical protein